MHKCMFGKIRFAMNTDMDAQMQTHKQFAIIFSYLMSKWTYLKYFETFKTAAILGSWWAF